LSVASGQGNSALKACFLLAIDLAIGIVVRAVGLVGHAVHNIAGVGIVKW
jgi:hypothetical protein